MFTDGIGVCAADPLNSAFETLVFRILDLFRISCFAFRISALACCRIMHGHLVRHLVLFRRSATTLAEPAEESTTLRVNGSGDLDCQASESPDEVGRSLASEGKPA